MSKSCIPVDLFNPGQVFACLGFLEAAEVLLGDAEGGFDWSDSANVRFRLKANGEANPFEVVLDYLANATPTRYAPIGFVASSAGQADEAEDGDESDDDGEDAEVPTSVAMYSETFPAKSGDATSLPLVLKSTDGPDVVLGHWQMEAVATLSNFMRVTGPQKRSLEP